MGEVKMKKPSQKDKILKWMKLGKTITPIQALDRFGCFRLSAIVYNLKHEGFTISKVLIKNKHGNHFAKYKLHP